VPARPAVVTAAPTLPGVPRIRLPPASPPRCDKTATKVSHPHPVKHGASWRTKSQIQALDRTAPILPMQPGLAERRSHDYVRHGTTTLFAALEIATGTVTAACQPRHRHQEFLRFLKQVAKTYPDRELRLVMDNYAAHKRPEIRDWLDANPRVQVHFTPTSGSWLNLVEVWFGIIERQAIRRGTFRSVKELNTKIRAFIDNWNDDRAHPFVWTKTADQILTKANRPTTSNSDH